MATRKSHHADESETVAIQAAMTDTSSATRRYTIGAWVISIIGGTSVVLAICAYFLWPGRATLGFSHSSDDWGTFGAFLTGFAGTFISLGTLIAVAVTFRLQAKELAESRVLLIAQAEAAALQAFESNFFQLLRRFSEHVASIKYSNTLQGREALELHVRHWMQTYYKTFHEDRQFGGDATRAAYERLYNDREGEFGVYFRTLYHVFKLIDRSRLTHRQKVDYANIARAQLSAYELCLLFYNCMAGEGREGFGPLVEKFGILKHLNRELLVDPGRADDRTLYSLNAFADEELRDRLARDAAASPRR